jgi:hypothetical protein
MMVLAGVNNAPSAHYIACNRTKMRLQAEKFKLSGDNTLGLTLTTIEAVMTS